MRCKKGRKRRGKKKKKLEARLVFWMKKRTGAGEREADGISRTKKERERRRYKKKRAVEKKRGGGLGATLKCKVMIYLSMLFCCTPNLTETLIHV